MNDNLFLDNLKQSTVMRIFLYLVILLISSLIGLVFTAAFMFAGYVGMKIAQGLSSIMMFVMPPIVYYFITRKKRQMQALGFRSIHRPWLLYIIIGIALMYVSLPVTNQLTVWNEGFYHNGSFDWLNEWIAKLEEQTTALTKKMLTVDTFGGLLFNLLIIALIPAIGEELTFRGVLQQSLTQGLKNPHVAIILSAAIFSFIHFQFMGFLPRMFLGMLLGYMFYISGSLWTCIAMHFVNNGTAVVLFYLDHKGVVDIDVDHFGMMDSLWMVGLSAVVTAGLIIWCWWKAKHTKKGDD